MYTHVGIVGSRYGRHLTVSLVRFIFYFNHGITRRPLISLDALRAFRTRPVQQSKIAMELTSFHSRSR